MCCVSTTDEVTAGALPAPLLELIDAKVPNGAGRARQGVRIGLHEEADAARRLRAVARGALRRDLGRLRARRRSAGGRVRGAGVRTESAGERRRSAGHGGRDQRPGFPVPVRLGGRGARCLGAGRPSRDPPRDRRRARLRGPDRPGPARPTDRGPRVPDALRARAAADRAGADRARAGDPRHPRRRPPGRSGLRADEGSGTGHDRHRERRVGPVPGGRGRRDRRVPRVAARSELHLPWLPRVRARRSPRRAGPRRGPRIGPRHLVEGRLVGVRTAGAARDDRAEPARPHRGRRPSHLLEDEPALDGASARPDGLHRRTPGLARRTNRRRGADGGPVHLQGVRGAREQDAAAAPQARADRGRRGPVRGVARLQGGGVDLRELPEGRAVRRSRPRSSDSR